MYPQINPKSTGPNPPPLDHVLRANLPWRSDEMTECGRRSNDVKSMITIDQFKDRLKQLGKQRTAYTVCMTCWHTCVHQAQWDTDPVGVMNRWTQRAQDDHTDQMAVELRAIAAMIAAHRDEFDQYITDSAQVTDLAARRKGHR